MPDPPPPPKYHLRDLLIAVLIGAAALALTMNWARLGIGEPERRDLFAQVFGGPPPASVQVINGSSRTRWEGSNYVWLHFRIAPEDFEKLLLAEPYNNFGPGAQNYSAYEPPSWWNADTLGANSRCYGREIPPRLGRDRSSRDFVVNEKGDEVFLLMRSWYNY